MDDILKIKDVVQGGRNWKIGINRKTPMPSKKVVTPIEGGEYYHIFNRGNNKEIVFIQ